ncbi:MAG: hypothetical protein IJW24_04470 [Clostridia bacterium]|nr:hypothetical protein [Clostridia bacterium]
MNKFKTVVSPIFVLVLLVGSFVLGYVARDKGWIMLDKNNGKTTLTIANVKFAIGTLMNDFEENSITLEDVGTSTAETNTVDSYFNLSSDKYQDMSTAVTDDFYTTAGSGLVSQYYDFMFKPFLELAFDDEFKLNENFEKEMNCLPIQTQAKHIGKCTVDSNNKIVLNYYITSDLTGNNAANSTVAAVRVSIDFDFTDNSYAFDYSFVSNAAGSNKMAVIAHIEKDKSAFADNFDKPAFTKYSVIRADQSTGEWNKDNSVLDIVIDFDLVNKKFCRIDSGASSLATSTKTVLAEVGATKNAELINKYFFDNKVVELIETTAEELGIN